MSNDNPQNSEIPPTVWGFLDWLKTSKGKENTEYLRNEATDIDHSLVSQVGEDIRAIRERLGLERMVFAKMLGIEVGFLIFVETGHAPFSEANKLLQKAQEMFGTPPQEE